MAKAYHIEQWALYESSDTKKTENMSWYKKRTKLVGLGIGRIMREPYPRNMEFFGIWTILETLATQSSPRHRGWLVRDCVPLDFDSMAALIPTVPAEAFKGACEWFVANIPGWLQLKEFPDAPPTLGTPPGDSPANPPTLGTPPGDSPPRERDRKSSDRERKPRESNAPADVPEVPSEEEVRAWARTHDVDEGYARKQFEKTTEQNGWVKNRRLIDWRKQFLRYWTEDKDDFQRKKTAERYGRPATRPDAWKDGDRDWWWSDPFEKVEAALQGALMGNDKKTARRLKEILEKRKTNNK